MAGNFCREPPEVLRNTWRVSDAKTSSLGDFDFRSQLQRFDAPVLVIKGREAGLPPTWVEPWASAAHDGRMLWIDSAGVAVWVEKPTQVFPAIRTFLQGNWPSDAVKPAG